MLKSQTPHMYSGTVTAWRFHDCYQWQYTYITCNVAERKTNMMSASHGRLGINCSVVHINPCSKHVGWLNYTLVTPEYARVQKQLLNALQNRRCGILAQQQCFRFVPCQVDAELVSPTNPSQWAIEVQPFRFTHASPLQWPTAILKISLAQWCQYSFRDDSERHEHWSVCTNDT